MKALFLWAWLLLGVMLLGFAAPALISARDTFAVIVGIALIISFVATTGAIVMRILFPTIKDKS